MNNPIEEMNNPKEEMNDPNKNEFKIAKLVRFALDSQVFPKEFENLNEKNLILEKKKLWLSKLNSLKVKIIWKN